MSPSARHQRIQESRREYGHQRETKHLLESARLVWSKRRMAHRSQHVREPADSGLPQEREPKDPMRIGKGVVELQSYGKGTEQNIENRLCEPRDSKRINALNEFAMNLSLSQEKY